MVHGNPFFISVVAPVAAILLMNFTMLIVVMKKLHSHGNNSAVMRNLNAGKVKNSQLLADSRIAFTCNVLLGITWIFALCAVGKATMVFQWLFCIFNSLQGFFIFIFFTVRKEELRKILCVSFKLKTESQEFHEGESLGTVFCLVLLFFL